MVAEFGENACIIKPSFIYGGDDFGLLPPRVSGWCGKIDRLEIDRERHGQAVDDPYGSSRGSFSEDPHPSRAHTLAQPHTLA